MNFNNLILLANKMDSWRQEKNQLFKTIGLDGFANFFHQHYCYHSLPRTSVQHCNGVPLHGHLKNLMLIASKLEVYYLFLFNGGFPQGHIRRS
uniref:Uncharacterized protein MANES_03G056500 n=1 Tax=Rhizophora mucronata TaxID=61149 RepID=A0A2P2QLB9_RHIMU